jgi:DNA primase
MEKKYYSKNDIISKINILTIIEEFNIKLEKISSGNFDYRCRCPSKNHKGGHERTGSCYIDSIRNKFHCFGCQAGSNCIDFYMLCGDVLFNQALNELGSRTDSIASDSYSEIELKGFNNFFILFDISKLLRNTMLSHKDDLKWINALMMKIDESIQVLDSDDEDNSKKLFLQISKTINKRYGVK